MHTKADKCNASGKTILIRIQTLKLSNEGAHKKGSQYQVGDYGNIHGARPKIRP